MKDDIDNFFGELGLTESELAGALKRLNAYLLRHKMSGVGIGDNNVPNIASIDNMYKQHPEKFPSALKEVIEYVRFSLKMMKQFADFKERKSNKWDEDQILFKAKAIRGRNKIYWDWFHKLNRWVIGSLLAIFLYSFAVMLAEKYDFIKVPVNHTISQFKLV